MRERIWMSVTDSLEEGSPAQKKVAEKSHMEMDGGPGSLFTRISYKVPGVWREEAPYDVSGYVIFDLPEAGYMTKVGGPMLVQEGIFVAIPPNAVYKNMEIISSAAMELEGDVQILPVPKPVLESETPEFIENKDIYADEIYPKHVAEYAGEEEVMGVRCAHIFIFPLQYKMKEKKAILNTDIEIKVNFEPVDSGTEQAGFCNPTFRPLILGSEENGTDSGAKPRMLIITTDKLKESLKIYQGIKSFLYETDLVLAEDIYQRYPQKKHDEAILAYFIAEHERKPLTYAVLGGGISSIPTHKDGEGFACDSYYCTDGTSALPRFALSRFPADTKEEMERVCDIACYYDRFYNETRRKAIFTAYKRDDYIQCKQDIASSIKSGLEIIERNDGTWTKKQLTDSINEGAALINYRGHGAWDRWQSSNGLTVKDVRKLNVKKNTPIVLSLACSNNDLYRGECFGVSWVKNEKAVAFLGASNPSYTVVNHVFDKFLWEAIDNNRLSNIGDIYVWATLKLYQNDQSYYTKVNIREYMLLGDVSADYLQDDITHKMVQTV